MTLRYLLDTNLCIRVPRDRPPSVRERFNAEADGLAISTVVLAELLLHGAAKSARPIDNRTEVERFASRLEVLPFDAAAAHAADIRASLEREGRPVGGYDVLIAGHARSRGLVVVTGSLSEFGRVAGLRCEDWLAEG